MNKNNDKTKSHKVETTIETLVKEIENLTPFPSCPEYRGPIFTNMETGDFEYTESNSSSIISNDNLGFDFSVAAKGINYNDLVDQAADLVKEHTDQIAEISRSFALGQHNVISFDFAAASSNDDQIMAKFKAELPRRLGLERMLADALRKIHALHIKPNFKLPNIAVA